MNAVVETYEGRTTVQKRPGLSGIATPSGLARGVVCYGGSLISLYGTTVYAVNTVPSQRFGLQFEGAEGSSTVTNDGVGGTINTASSLHRITNDFSSAGSGSLYVANPDDFGFTCTTVTKALFSQDWDLSFKVRFSSTGVSNTSGTPAVFGSLQLIRVTDANLDTFIPSISYQWHGSASGMTLRMSYNGSNNRDTVVSFDSFHEVRLERRGENATWYVNDSAVGTSFSLPVSTVYASTGTNIFSTPIEVEDVYPTNTKGVLIDEYDFTVLSQVTSVTGTLAAGTYDFAESSV